jgi:hypothetical protein
VNWFRQILSYCSDLYRENKIKHFIPVIDASGVIQFMCLAKNSTQGFYWRLGGTEVGYLKWSVMLGWGVGKIYLVVGAIIPTFRCMVGISWVHFVYRRCRQKYSVDTDLADSQMRWLHEKYSSDPTRLHILTNWKLFFKFFIIKLTTECQDPQPPSTGVKCHETFFYSSSLIHWQKSRFYSLS